MRKLCKLFLCINIFIFSILPICAFAQSQATTEQEQNLISSSDTKAQTLAKVDKILADTIDVSKLPKKKISV